MRRYTRDTNVPLACDDVCTGGAAADVVQMGVTLQCRRGGRMAECCRRIATNAPRVPRYTARRDGPRGCARLLAMPRGHGPTVDSHDGQPAKTGREQDVTEKIRKAACLGCVHGRQ